MKLDPRAVEVLMHSGRPNQPTNKLVITKNGLTISSSLVEKIEFPEYVRFYVDRKSRHLFIAKTSKDAKGARKFYNKNSKSGTVCISSQVLLNQIVEAFNLIRKYRYELSAEIVEGRESTTLGFDMNKAIIKED